MITSASAFSVQHISNASSEEELEDEEDELAKMLTYFIL